MRRIIPLDVRGDFAITPVALWDGAELALVDCAFAQDVPHMAELLMQEGADLARLTGIVLTHCDGDHVGGLAELRRLYPSARVYASAEQAACIAGSRKHYRQAALELRLPSMPEEERAAALERIRTLQGLPRVPVDAVVRAGDVLPFCGGARVVDTSGHMPGHIAVYMETERTLITGDCLTAQNGRLLPPSVQYTLDMPLALARASALAKLPLDCVICYHGGPCTQGLAEALRGMAAPADR